MGTFNRDRFAKVLALAESDQDGEALAAVRKASEMARAAGMSLGQAVSGGESSAFGFSGNGGLASDAILNIAYRRIRDLEAMAASYREQLVAKLSRDAKYQEGWAVGFREGEASTGRKFANTDLYKAGYKAGYDDGQESERSATNRAYDRGYADGKASVTASARPSVKKKRGA